MADLKEMLGLAETLVKIAAIILAGLWTYLLFVRKRLGVPRINIELKTSDFRLPNGRRLIHAEIAVINIGDVILRTNSAELRLRQVAPIPEKVEELAEDGYDPVEAPRTEIDWPLIAGREWDLEGRPILELEPGEQEPLHADFVIEDSISIIEFYFYLANPAKKRKGLGWTLTRMQELSQEDSAMSEKKTTESGLRSQQQEKQQRQQPQQKPQQQQQQKQQQKRTS